MQQRIDRTTEMRRCWTATSVEQRDQVSTVMTTYQYRCGSSQRAGVPVVLFVIADGTVEPTERIEDVLFFAVFFVTGKSKRSERTSRSHFLPIRLCTSMDRQTPQRTWRDRLPMRSKRRVNPSLQGASRRMAKARRRLDRR